MESTRTMQGICAAAMLAFSSCAGIQVGQQVQAGRNALQTGRPSEAVGFLRAAVEADPGYRLPYRVSSGVLTYLGRAYYETGQLKEAQIALEQSANRDHQDHLARVYLGLARLRSGESDHGRQVVESGLRGIRETLDYLNEDIVSGIFWDPAGTLRADIAATLGSKPDTALLIASAERIGRQFDREIDEARRDEARTTLRSGGGGGE